MANAPKRIIRKAEPGVTATHVVVTVVLTIVLTIAIKAWIKDPRSPLPSDWADLA